MPACAERLAWLTGFTGSAGFAIVLPDTAWIFSDGRYQTQLNAEVDPDVWTIAHMYETPGPQWLRTNGAELTIGYDPRTMSESELRAYTDAGCIMQALSENPIDTLWEDRPPVPDSPVELLPETVTGTSAEFHIRTVADALKNAQQDAAVISDPTSVAWLLNIRAHDLEFLPVALCCAVVTADAKVQLFIDPTRISPPICRALASHVTITPPSDIGASLAGLRHLRIRLDPQRSNAWFWQQLRDGGAFPVADTDPCLLLRARKTQAERDGMVRAHHLDGIALCKFLCWLEAHGIGHTEAQAADRLLAFRRDHTACQGASFATIAAAGANAAIMHYTPHPTKSAQLKEDRFFLIDSGGQYHFGTTDVTRTVWLGNKCPPDTWRDQYTRVLKGLIALSCAKFPAGTPGYRLDPLARFALWNVDLDFDHGAGHGLGSYLSVHEWPLGFTRRPVLDPIEEHMVLTNEPGYYAPGSHGMRLENAMQVRRHNDSGTFLEFHTLTLAPIDRRGIDRTILGHEERNWIDDYHARVLREIGPALTERELQWLEGACAPL